MEDLSAPWIPVYGRTWLLSSVQFQSLSRVRLFETPWTTARQASLSITNSRVYPNSCPLSWWCHPIISSSAVPFSSCLQSFSAWGSFPMSQLWASGGQSIGVTASTSVLSMNTQDYISFRMDWFDLLAVQGTLKSLLQHHSSKASISSMLSFLYSPTLTSIHDYWKNYSLD